LYSGIHYDAVALADPRSKPGQKDVTVFDATDDVAMIQALSVAEQEKKV
jgi:hypothetical protein